jgi:hypothetical protein
MPRSMFSFDQTPPGHHVLVCQTIAGVITMLRKLVFVLVAATAFGSVAFSPNPASAYGRGHGWGHSHWAHSWGHSGRGHRGWGHHSWRHGRR